MEKEFGSDVDNVEVELGRTETLGNIWTECDVCQIEMRGGEDLRCHK